MKLTSYDIRHYDGSRRAVWGYVYDVDGRAYGIDRRPETGRWTITDVETGMIPGATSYPTRAAAVADLERIADNMRRRISAAKLEQLAREFAALPDGAPLYDKPAPRKPSASPYALTRARAITYDAPDGDPHGAHTFAVRDGYVFADHGYTFAVVRRRTCWKVYEQTTGIVCPLDGFVTGGNTRAKTLELFAANADKIAHAVACMMERPDYPEWVADAARAAA